MAKDKSGPVAPISVVSLHSPNLLASPKRAGFHRRWIRNAEEDVEAAKEVGFQVVHKEGTDSPHTRRDMVLMERPQAIDDERTRLRVEHVKANRRALQRSAQRESDDMARRPELRGVVSTFGTVSVEGGESESK